MKQNVTVELFYDAAWQNVTSDVYVRDGIKLSHGRGDEQATAPPSSCELTLRNTSGAYNPRNPESALFGKIGRNTPLRVSVGSDSRFAGEVAVWEPRRATDNGDAWVKVTANGISRRLGQGSAPLRSAPRVYLPTTGPAAYWPLEDGQQSIQGAPLVGSQPMTLYSQIAPQSWGQGDLAPWLAPVLKMGGSTTAVSLNGRLTLPGFTNTWTADWMRSGGTEGFTDVFWFFDRAGTGLFGGVIFEGDTNTVRIVRGTELDTAIVPDAFDDRPHHMRLTLAQSGADIQHTVWLDGVEILSAVETSQTLTPLGRISPSVIDTPQLALLIGHVAVWTTPPALADAVEVAFGHSGEAAGRRIERLCSEQSVAFTSTGDLDDTAPLGAQYVDTFGDVVSEAAHTDLGVLVDDVAAVGLHYRTRTSLLDQAAVLVLGFDAGGIAPTLDPAVDDQQVRNDVTAKRRDGGDAQAVDEDGPLGVNTIGRYDTSVTLNTPGDGFLPDHAGWRLHLGTTDDDRWPRVAVDLDAAPALAATVSAVRVGDRITLDNLPDTIAGVEQASLLVQGWTEDIGSHRRVVTFVCTPETPWRVAEYESAAGASENKYDTAGTELAEDVDTTETAINVLTTIGPEWTLDNAEDGFDIIVGGEVMTVTDIADAGAFQQFTVVRSVNGVSKTHLNGAGPVRLHPTPRYAL